MSYTITGDNSTVTFDMPIYIVKGTSRDIVNYVFSDNTDTQSDMGKLSDYVSFNGVVYSSATTYLHTVDTMMDNGEEVTVDGFSDSNLNSDYLVSDLQYNHIGGQKNIYHYSITLERLSD